MIMVERFAVYDLARRLFIMDNLTGKQIAECVMPEDAKLIVDLMNRGIRSPETIGQICEEVQY